MSEVSDIQTAARQMAFAIPRRLLQSAMHDLPWSDPSTALTLRRILDATTEDPVRLEIVSDGVARGADGDRVEKYARAICAANDVDPEALMYDDDTPEWLFYQDDARAAIALADAEGSRVTNP